MNAKSLYSIESTQRPTVECSSEVGRRILMQVRDLCKAFGGQLILDGVSLDLHEGDVVLLRGDNGSGKTTLLNILTGNLEPDSGSIRIDANGSDEYFEFPSHWWHKFSPLDRFTPDNVAREAVGRTWQDIRLFGTLTLLDNIAVATPAQPGENPFSVLMRNKAVRKFERNNQRECWELLANIGLSDRGNSSADKISLGQTKRVAITRAIRAGARILFLDEPLAGLDVNGIEDILGMLKPLAEQHRVTLVIVEHVFNIPRILDFAQTVWTLNNGLLKIEAACRVSDQCSKGFESVVHKLLDQFSESGFQVYEEEIYGGAKLLRIADLAENTNPKVPILDVRSLVVRRNNRLVIGQHLEDGSIHGFSLSLYQREIAILFAPNGWGKTTLLEAISGIVPIEQGEIFLNGNEINRLPIWERVRLGIQFFPAKNDLFPSLSVSEFMSLIRHPQHRKSSFPQINTLIGELSGGELKRLALNNLSVHGPVMFLDEPFLGLDSESVSIVDKEIAHFVKNLSGSLLIVFPAATDYEHFPLTLS